MTVKRLREAIIEGRHGFVAETKNPYATRTQPILWSAWNLGHAAAERFRAGARDWTDADFTPSRLDDAQVCFCLCVAGVTLINTPPIEIRHEHDAHLKRHETMFAEVDDE